MRVTNFGGNANNGTNAGAWNWNLNNDSGNSNQNIGSRLVIYLSSKNKSVQPDHLVKHM